MTKNNAFKNYLFIPLFGTVILLMSLGCGAQEKDRILVFTKTDGFVHESIPAGKVALMQAGREAGFEVDTTSDASEFRDNLKKYEVVVFLNTTGNVLNERQQSAFEKFIQAGGGFVGIHSAADTEYDWPWYGKLVGGYFKSHPHIQEAVINVVDRDHISTAHLPKQWEREDEWYNYKELNPEVNFLATLNEESYEGGENGEHHPIAWFHHYDGGRAFYTGGGHTSISYEEPDFLKHVLNGILWAAGRK
ncbi:ThuA domain-containing protein [Salinimicrobium flavum]|uniref:ThuA domain-containing protein n=1 Tax=Salinimicrobium flavum TaxID=1737065 RepID=A0ABW5IZG0_9FLAO